MSGDPKRSSYRARQRGFAPGPNRTVGELMAQAKLVDAPETMEKFRNSYVLQQGDTPSSTTRPSPSSEG